MEQNSVLSCVSFKWKIPNISKVRNIPSPQFTVCGLPWRFEIVKTCSDDSSLLSVYLHCLKEYDEEAVWSCAATGSFKLLTLSHDCRTEIEVPIGPFVFDQMKSAFGRTTMINWKSLSNPVRTCAIDDTVEFEFKLDVADPIQENRSRIIFSRHSNTRFRLMVTNIDNLMAARSSPFIYQKMQFNLVVYKSHKSLCSHLGVSLHKRGSSSSDRPLKIRMAAKVLASKYESSKKIQTNAWDENTLKIERLISYDALFDRRSGFIDYDNIIMEVELA